MSQPSKLLLRWELDRRLDDIAGRGIEVWGPAPNYPVPYWPDEVHPVDCSIWVSADSCGAGLWHWHVTLSRHVDHPGQCTEQHGCAMRFAGCTRTREEAQQAAEDALRGAVALQRGGAR